MGHRSNTKVASLKQQATLPLHAKMVDTILIAEVRSLMTPQAQARLDLLLDQMTTAPKVTGDRHRLKAPNAHADQLVATGLASEVSREEALTLSPLQYFSVVEDKIVAEADATAHETVHTATSTTTERQRPIFWPEAQLAQSRYDSNMSLRTAKRLRDITAKHSAGAAFDVKASYTQVEMPRFVFQSKDGRFFKLLRMPYGLDGAAEIMQLLVSAVAGVDGVAAKPAEADLAVHIDNVIAAGDIDTVTLWTTEFKQRAAKVRMTLNVEQSNTPAAKVPFCGAVADFAKSEIYLRHQFMFKLRTQLESGRSTVRHWQSLHARLVYAAALLGINMLATRDEFFFTKIVRRLCNSVNNRTVSAEASCTLPPTAANGMRSVIAKVGANTPASVVSLDHSWASADNVLFVDATPKGWGAVYAAPGAKLEAFGASWESELPINEAETLAVFTALDELRNRHPGVEHSRVHLRIDNTSSLWAHRGRGKSGTLQYIAAATRERFPHLTADYVASAANLADRPSRWG